MADTSTTTNMQLILPTPSTRTGPQFANDINTALTRVDAHDHSELNGVKVTPAGLDITADLDFQSNNIDDTRSVRLTDQLANLSGANDVTAIYAKEGDLWFNNDTGTQIQVTSGGALNTGAIVTNVWTTEATNSNLTISGAATYTNILVSSSSAITITLPAANAVAAGRYFVIQDVTGTSQTYAITLTPVSAATINGASGSKTLSSQYGTWFVRSDGISKWMLTYSGFSGLTAASLTYGTTVLSSSGLTAPAVTTTSNVTVGGTLGVTGATTLAATTLSGALTGTSGHFTSNLTVDGNLTVNGTVSFDAGSLAISSITGGSIISCTITGGTMSGTTISGSLISGGTISSATITSPTITSPAITNGTISGATLTGGNIGAGGGIATLDSSGYLTSSQRTGWIVSATSSMVNSSVSQSGSTYQIVPNFASSVSCSAGDILMINCVMVFRAAAGAQIAYKMVITDGSTNVDPRQYCYGYAVTTSGSTDTLTLARSFAYTVVNSGTVVVRPYCRSPSANSYTVAGYDVIALADPTASTLSILQIRP